MKTEMKGEERSTLVKFNCLAVESVYAAGSMNASALQVDSRLNNWIS